MAGVAAGLVAGLIIGDDETDLAEAGARIRASLASAASILEVVEIEYRESVDDAGVVREAEYEGSLDALARSRSEFEAAEGGLSAIDADRAEDIDRSYDEVRSLMDEVAPPDEVSAALEVLEGRLVPD